MFMNSGFRKIIACLSLLILSINVPAQDIPALKDDPSVLKGVMPNGMSYYLMSNPTSKGRADFALVQKVGRKNTDDNTGLEAVRVSREALSRLPHIKGPSPQDFLFRHGTAPGKNGFVKVSDDATLFHLSGVNVKDGKSAVDSMLLFLLDLTDRTYSPADQAVIVSGDIDAESVASRLVSMSYMVPAKDTDRFRTHLVTRNDDPVFDCGVQEGGLADVTVSWTSQRPPREYMNTVQTAVFEKTVNTLGDIASARIRRSMKDRGIPVADVSSTFVSSASGPYDDKFSVSVTVRDYDAPAALEVMAGVMASIDGYGVGESEFLRSEAVCMNRLEEQASSVWISDKDNVRRCADAFLYNASLASSKEKLAFHKSRNLPDAMRLKYFNDIAMALLDGSAGLSVVCPGDSSQVRRAFESAWDSAEAWASSPLAGLDVLPGKTEKIRIRSVKKEPVSGGSVWTFSNGFKVICRKMPSDRVYYNLALNGGTGNIDGIAPGEAAFVSDYMKTCDVCGLEADEFKGLLEKEGVIMNAKANMSNIMINGHVRKDKLELLMRVLLAAANGRKRNDETFRYYKECEYLALEKAQGGFVSRMTAIDSIMCPDYRYSPYKQKGRITGRFQDNVEAFLELRSSKMNDGVLVLAGNVDEEALKKMLAEYVGGFRTSDVALRRPVTRYQPVSGWSTYTMEGDMDNVDVALSARIPVTAENYMAADIASMVLKRRLEEALKDSGMCLSLSYNCRIYPEERLNMLISVSEASGDGFATGAARRSPMEALGEVRSVLADMRLMEISDETLAECKEALKKIVEVEMTDPAYWTDAITLRYLDGKDLTTGYAAKIDAVTADKVRNVFAVLNEGSKVEYVISR